MLDSRPFLTQLDSRAAIKGSRDPLGVQAIWTRFGRHVVGNLTTVSNSVRDFTVLLLGYYFAERVADEGGTEGDLATFLKWEQLAAYAQAHVDQTRGFRGTERVFRNLGEGDRVSLGVDPASQILGNQKTYGLWGLYTMPAKSSGLLEGDPTRLTDRGRQLVEEAYLPQLRAGGTRAGRAIVERLTGERYLLDVRAKSRDLPVLESVAAALRSIPPQAASVYRASLLWGGDNDADVHRGTCGKQPLFAELLVPTLDVHEWRMTPESIAEVASAANERGEVGSALGERLSRVRTCEQVLAPAVALFEHALARDGVAASDIAAQVQQQWGSMPRQTIDIAATDAIEPELRAWSENHESGQRWVALARALHAGEYRDALDHVLAQNAAVMGARSGSAPWAAVEASTGKLRVSFRDENLAQLPEAAELPQYWRHAYFIESLRSVARALREAA